MYFLEFIKLFLGFIKCFLGFSKCLSVFLGFLGYGHSAVPFERKRCP